MINFDMLHAPLKNDLFSADFVYHHRLVALGCKDKMLYIGVAEDNPQICTKIAFYSEMPVTPVIIEETLLNKYIETHYPVDGLAKQLQETLQQVEITEETFIEEENDEPVSLFVSELLQNAKNKNISDIHIEQQEQECLIRFRTDGLLTQAATIPPHLARRVITRLKIMANMNIAERRLPQDGRIKSFIDIRVNTCPTLYGEKMVLRLLNNSAMPHELWRLGMTESQLSQTYAALSKPQGMIIVTGPTGSGKTVTLCSALHYLNQREKNIVTIENPIEVSLPGVNQINIHNEIGLNFASALHAVLRQDPDIIMVGEIRDYETASIALQAAQTGHLVLTTLHTNNAADTLTRLQSLGLQKHYLSDTISLIIAQRLLRTLCPHCKTPVPENAGVYRAVGCEHCVGGYKGRVGVFECKGKQNDYVKLWEAATMKVVSGLTTQEEVMRYIA